MTKTFCDCCEREIKEKDIKWNLSASFTKDRLTSGVWHKTLCMSCGEKIGFIKTN